MIGIVGNLVFEYTYKGKAYAQVFNPSKTDEIKLADGEITVAVDEVTYIEDTIYGVELSYLDYDWYVSGNTARVFEIPELDLRGTVILSFSQK